MKELLKDKIQINFEKNIKESFLIIHINSNEKIFNYQIKMLENNQSIGILPLTCREINGSIKLYFDTTSKIPLSQFIEKNTLTKDDFILILHKIIKIIIESKNYLLYDKNFFIDEDFIFIEPDTLDIKLLYLPILLEVDALSNLKKFILRIITNASIEENNSDNFIQRIINITKKETFSISLLEDLLINLNNNNLILSSGKKEVVEEIAEELIEEVLIEPYGQESPTKKSKNFLMQFLDKKDKEPSIKFEIPKLEFLNKNTNTEILASSIKKTPFLKKLSDDIQVSLLKSPFLIGRLKGEVDLVIENQSVGKKHAQILIKNNSYYLVDLSSKNGTFINGEKLNANKKYLLKDNDKIVFSDVDFMFKKE